MMYVTSVFKLTLSSQTSSRLSAWKPDASLAKKYLTASEAAHLSTRALIQKLDEVAKTVDLDVSTILGEENEGPSTWYCTFLDS